MTTRRPLLTQRPRPSSQVYIGQDPQYSSYISSPPDLPDLPEPPSPGSSSSTSASGLPSPPATNSTGSGSTGDPGSIAVRGGGLNMLNGTNIKAFHAAFHSSGDNHDEDEYDNDNDDEGEDNTARLNQRRHSASENVLALQRVKSLTERNKMALNKLSSFSRLSSPSPNIRPASSTRYPPSQSSSSDSKSNSNSASISNSTSNSSSSTRPSIRRSRTSHDPQSGSETERDDMPAPSAHNSPAARPTTPLPPTRQRLVSAPASPQKHITAAASSSSGGSGSGSSTRSPRRSAMRMSALAFTSSLGDGGRDHEGGYEGRSSPEDITRAAMAAVEAARRSPSGGMGTARYTGTGGGGSRVSPQSTGSGKRRQPLPREWGLGAGSSGGGSSNGRHSTESPTSPPIQYQYPHPQTSSPNKRHSLAGSTASTSSSPLHHHAHSNSTSSTSTMTIGSTAAGRERSSTVRELARRHQTRWMSEDLGGGSGSAQGDGAERESERDRERRQSLRGGSAESALGAGRSLVGEGLRAAGLAGRATAGGGGGGGDVFSQGSERSPARVEWAEGVLGSGSVRSQSQSRLGSGGGHARATTSMADYAAPRREREGDGEQQQQPMTPALRTYRSSANVLDAYGRAGSSLGGRYRGASVEREEARDRDQDRSRDRAAPSPSPYGSVRRHGHGPGASGQQEHTKLMVESLTVFEGHLNRVVGGGGGAADLARGAQTLVSAAERLNAILRAGTARALEEQIDAEVNGVDGAAAAELVEVWRRVGGEYREGLRVSDELVRGLTGLLLGVGRVVREFGDGRGSDEGRASASPDGRRSAESRRSLDAKDDRRISFGGRESALGVRPSSVLNTRHEVTTSGGPRNATPSSTRRLLTPRERRELQAGGIIPSDSQETILAGDYEPSPTPASRKQNDRSRTLPPISIPKPLPSLPSENTSTLRQNQATTTTGNSAARRRTFTSSTVRGAGLLPSMTTPTTALTPHTVSNSSHDRSDARMAFPTLSRTDSDKSSGPTRSRNNTVTFSRPSAVALVGLQMQHERERQRTISGSGEDARNAALGQPSGSETEKDTRDSKRSIAVRGDRLRMSLDGGESTSHAADRSAAAGLGLPIGGGNLSTMGQKRERRRTVTDIWPPNGS